MSGSTTVGSTELQDEMPSSLVGFAEAATTVGFAGAGIMGDMPGGRMGKRVPFASTYTSMALGGREASLKVMLV